MSLRTDIIAGKLKLNRDIFSLNPSAVISLFILDFSDLAFDLQLPDQNEKNTVFHFHNNLKLTTNNILFNTDKKIDAISGKEDFDVFVAAPIQTEGFEFSGRGTLPTPKISITIQEDNLALLTALKRQIWALGDLTGAKLTRIRTLAKYLSPENFLDGNAPENNSYDRYAEFPRDIYYIDRKSAENKSFLEFELSSALDVQGLKLPGRIVSSTRCVWQYRGAGCNYEFEYRSGPEFDGVETVHGYYGTAQHLNQTLLPSWAPAVATINNEKITDIIGGQNIGFGGEYNRLGQSTYKKGVSVYLLKNGIKYHYVCKTDNPTTAPPDTTDWIADQCSKTIQGCKLRWGPNGKADYGLARSPELFLAISAGYNREYLPFGGFPATQRAT